MSLRLIGLKLSTSLSTNTPAKVRALLCPFVYLYVSLLVCLSVRLCACVSVCLCVCVPFLHLQVCLSTFMTTSSGSVVRPARKVNPNSLNAGNTDYIDYTGYTGYSGYDTGEVIVNEAADFAPVQQLPAALEDEFWDYDKQVDLEGRLGVSWRQKFSLTLIKFNSMIENPRNYTYHAETLP